LISYLKSLSRKKNFVKPDAHLIDGTGLEVTSLTFLEFLL